jgi:hypothetical protein
MIQNLRVMRNLHGKMISYGQNGAADKRSPVKRHSRRTIDDRPAAFP